MTQAILVYISAKEYQPYDAVHNVSVENSGAEKSQFNSSKGSLNNSHRYVLHDLCTMRETNIRVRLLGLSNL